MVFVTHRSSILVIDDDPTLQQMLSLVLELEGYSTFCASNGAEGLQLLKDGIRPEIIILDLMMPVLNGFEFIDRLQKFPKDVATLPIIVLTAADQRLLNDPRLEHASSVLKKPFQVESLIRQIEQILFHSHDQKEALL